MTGAADIMQAFADKGLSFPDAIDLLRLIESTVLIADVRSLSETRSKAAIRQARYAAKKASAKNVSADVINPSPSLPYDNNSTPTLPHPSSSVPSEDSDAAEEKTKPQSVAAEIRQILGEVLNPQTVKDVILYRKAIKAALTVRATQLLAQKFLACGDPERGAEMMISRGWRGFEVEWFKKSQSARGSPSDRGWSKIANLGNSEENQNGNGPYTIDVTPNRTDDSEQVGQRSSDLLSF